MQQETLEELVEEVLGGERLSAGAVQVGSRTAPSRLAKISYTHDAMIDLVIMRPGMSQAQIGAHFGYSAAWISTVMASDAFQSRLAARREEVIDPVIRASMEERFKGLVSRSLEVLQEKLEKPNVSDTVALRALELGAKALGLGGHAPPVQVPVDLNRLAERLVALNPNRRLERTVEGEVIQEVVNG